MKKFLMKKILKAITLTLSLALMMCGLASCSAPEYSEIEDRLKYLIEESQEVNRIIFGQGLETYKRVYEPEVKLYRGEEKNYYYYEIEDSEQGRIIAYRGALDFGSDYKYLIESKAEDTNKTAVYVSEGGAFYYPIEYTEKEYDFYYNAQSPEDYDYVKMDSEINSIEQIKEQAERVYSKAYLEDCVYEGLFVGAVMGGDLDDLGARYIEYQDVDLGIVLMKSNRNNGVEKFDKRIFLYDTAEMVKPSNKNTVNVRMDTYAESEPDEIVSVRVTLVMQDGEWYLDSPTY